MSNASPPLFDEAFQDDLKSLFSWRRDVRRFLSTPLADGLLESLIEEACLAPSVGNSQPWRFVIVDAPERRNAVIRNFEDANAQALADYEGEQAQQYASLKLSGLRDAPTHLAVFCDRETAAGHGLGSKTMPETLDYSVVAAIQTLWLAARAAGVGIGWVSILNPDAAHKTLDVPENWRLIAYLCIGYPQEEHEDPELVRHGWQDRLPLSDVLIKR